LKKLGNVKVQLIVRNGEMKSRKSLMTWKIRKYGISYQWKTFRKKDDASNVNGSSRSNVTAFLEQDW
jgi:hypothetical protein